MIAIWFIAHQVELPESTSKMDSGDARPRDPLVNTGLEKKAVPGVGKEEQVETVETGTSSVPTFPRYLEFSDGNASGEVGSGTTSDGLAEYQLLGLGIRTVSFLGIQVYVVGMYVATDDIAALQEKLIRKIDPVATTLVPEEKAKLKALLTSPEDSEEAWNQVLKEANIRTIFRIVPVRNTDFQHMRDAWVRSVAARAQKNNEEYGDEKFGDALAEFKQVFGKGSVPKAREMLLSRNKDGKLAIWYDDGKLGSRKLGEIQDERLSRAVWLNYLGGKTVSSESARRNIVEGIMEFVERPVGTVATQVHA
jgi:hypothetical protein